MVMGVIIEWEIGCAVDAYLTTNALGGGGGNVWEWENEDKMCAAFVTPLSALTTLQA